MVTQNVPIGQWYTARVSTLSDSEGVKVEIMCLSIFWHLLIIRKYMKTIWMILSLVFGLLFFSLGCMNGADKVQYFGAILLFVGLIGLFEKIWPEEEGV